MEKAQPKPVGGTEAAATSNVHPRDVLKRYLWWGLGFAIFLAICFGIKNEISKPKPTAAQAQALTVCQNVTAKETRSCLITSEWSNEVTLADGSEANGKNFCGYPKMTYERRDENGTTYWRFKTNGSAIMKYRLFPAGESCPKVL